VRLRLFGVCLPAIGIASGQEPAPRKLELRGDRFPGLTYEQMTPPQKAMTDRALAPPSRPRRKSWVSAAWSS
jgi:hypothetical protein